MVAAVIRLLHAGASCGVLLTLASLLGAAAKGNFRRNTGLAVCNSLSKHRLRESACHNHTNSTFRTLPFLITGVGGSGTRFVSHAFSLNGIDLKHEKLGADGAVSWKYAVDPGLLPVKRYEDQMPVRPAFPVVFRHVVHLVRCPIHVMSAMSNWPPYVFEYMGAHVRLSRTRDVALSDLWLDVVTYAEAWLRWNQHVQRYAAVRFRIDEFASLYRYVCSRLHRCAPKPVAPAYTIGQGKLLTFTWRELREASPVLAHEVWKLSVEYGFGRDCTED